MKHTSTWLKQCTEFQTSIKERNIQSVAKCVTNGSANSEINICPIKKYGWV